MASKKIVSFIFLASLLPQTIMSEEYKFDAILNGDVIGQHTFNINETKTTSKAEFNIEFLFMDIYYKHQSEEVWDNNCLVKIDSKTDDDGDLYEVSGKLKGEKFHIMTNDKNGELPKCISSFAYWNHKILKKTKLLNSQNAEWLDINTKLIGTEELEVKDNIIIAKHYLLIASNEDAEQLKIHLWYDQNMNWVGLLSLSLIHI